MLIRTNTGMTLDGFMATPNGIPIHGTLPDFEPGVTHGMSEFLKECEAVVVGRNTFDAGHNYWAEHGTDWPWDGMKVFVLTSRPLPDRVHETVVASASTPEDLLAGLRDARLERDVHLVGGKRTIRAFHEMGAIDRLGLLVLPILVGDGVPLFPLGSPGESLRLESHQTFPDGTAQLVYATS